MVGKVVCNCVLSFDICVFGKLWKLVQKWSVINELQSLWDLDISSLHRNVMDANIEHDHMNGVHSYGSAFMIL
jgi:hypothetical protein